jgi:hypothetical protein
MVVGRRNHLHLMIATVDPTENRHTTTTPSNPSLTMQILAWSPDWPQAH